ncbi:uncharacterized protein LOC118191776 [Stegodyphus dumicola]|uniref:uncharacterized protein LOC118191776 n=1 Tax=Stegodyphus dumicola TaxID=202533 RepID=UPI0015B26E17|nr:uncharacterized protein LOC118191776 [Stegodyphus dumicola]
MDNDEGFTEVGFKEETATENWADTSSSIVVASSLPESYSSFQMADKAREVNQDTTNCEDKWNLQQTVKDLLNLFTDSSLFRWITIFIMLVVVVLSCYMFLKLIGFGILPLERVTHSKEKLLVKIPSYEEQAELSVNEIFQQIKGQPLKLKCKIRNVNCMKGKHHVKESGNENILKGAESLTEKLEVQSWNLNCVIESILNDSKLNDVPSKNIVRHMRNKYNIPVIKFHSTENIEPKVEDEGFVAQFYDYLKRMKDTCCGVFQTCLEIPKTVLKVGKALLSTCQEYFKKWEKKVEILIAVLFFACVAFKLVLPDYIINFEKYVIFFYFSINFMYFTLVLLQWT